MNGTIRFVHLMTDFSKRPSDSLISCVDHALVLSFDKVGKHRDFICDLLWKLSDTTRILLGSVRHYRRGAILEEIDRYPLAKSQAFLLATRHDWLWFLSTDESVLRRFLDENWNTYGGNWVFFANPSDELVRRIASMSDAAPMQKALTRWRDAFVRDCALAAITFDDDILDIVSTTLDESEAIGSIRKRALRYRIKLRERTA